MANAKDNDIPRVTDHDCIFRPTMEFRWLKPACIIYMQVLQQKWVGETYGTVEWRDVPTVKE